MVTDAPRSHPGDAGTLPAGDTAAALQTWPTPPLHQWGIPPTHAVGTTSKSSSCRVGGAVARAALLGRDR